MKPLDQVLRDWMWPTLKAAGFRRTTGRVFTLEDGDGNGAVVFVHAFRLGRHDSEFFVDMYVQPSIWRDWVIHRYGRPPVSGGGLVRRRLDSGGQSKLWSIDLDDVAAGMHLMSTLHARLPSLLELMDPKVLAVYTPQLTEEWSVGLPEMPLAMLGPSPQLDKVFEELAAHEPVPGFDSDAYIRFLRDWVATHRDVEHDVSTFE